MAVEELRSSRSGRKATRAESRERQQEQEEQNAFNSMTYEQFQAERDAYQDKIRSLEEASRGKDAELSEMKARLQGKQHEAKKAKKAVKTTKDSAAKKLESTFDSAASTSDTTRNEIKVTDIELVAIVYSVLESSGISRVNLTSESFHEKNPGAAKLFFGFETYDELRHYVSALFPDVNVNKIGKVRRDKRRKSCSVYPKRLTPFEQCLATIMFFHSMPVRKKLAEQYLWLVVNSCQAKTVRY